MIVGIVEGREPLIPLTICGFRGRQQELEAVVDTGCTGWLTLPPAVIGALGGPMSPRLAVRLACVILGVALAASAAVGYIHFPPMTLQKMCKESHQIRLLIVDKLSKEKGVIVFEAAESLKGEKPQITAFKHVIRIDAAGTKPILDWAGEGKTAVMFYLESKPGGTVQGLGYVFIDGYCYSVDYNSAGRYWLMLRAEPGMSACYHGSVERLREAVKDILDGKEVKVPTKEPDAKVDRDQRNKEINEMLQRNR